MALGQPQAIRAEARGDRRGRHGGRRTPLARNGRPFMGGDRVEVAAEIYGLKVARADIETRSTTPRVRCWPPSLSACARKRRPRCHELRPRAQRAGRPHGAWRLPPTASI
jgi:hypothetical protein